MPSIGKKKKSKARKQANACEEAAEGSRETILRRVKELYEADGGLEQCARAVGMDTLRPRNKVSVMIIGNHSAGKSSFINWYVDEKARDTGMAIESRGFCVVTYGHKKTAPILGEGSLKYFPHLRGIKQFDGLMENFCTITSVNRARNNHLVDFIDTPGLVGGGVGYSFPVNESILHVADHVDMILVFLDPIGQALCDRTMEVVELLNKKHYEKIHYYLTKADTCRTIRDLMKVNSQVTQNLASKVTNNHGWEVPNIFLPTMTANKNMSAEQVEEMVKLNKVNAIGKLCDKINQEIAQKVQHNLVALAEDAKTIGEAVAAQIAAERTMQMASKSSRTRALMATVMAWTVVPLLAFMFAASSMKKYLPEHMQTHPAMDHIEKPAEAVHAIFPELSLLHIVGALLALFLGLQAASACYRWSSRQHIMRSPERFQQLEQHLQFCRTASQVRDQLHTQFVGASVRAD